MDRIEPVSSADLLTEGETAKLLTISPRTLQDWRLKGEGPPVRRIGRSVRYPLPHLLAWLDERALQHEKGLRCSVSATALLAVEVQGEEGRASRLAAWCPWCERAHRHGAAGGGGHRAPHCHDLSASPLRSTGYELDVIGPAASEAAVTPDGLMVGEGRLYEAANRASLDLRNQTLRLLLGLSRVGLNITEKRIGDGRVFVLFRKAWRIHRKGKANLEGEGLLRLAAELYGVSSGVAAVRILEAATAETLDAKAALGLQRVIDDWVSRGAPKRGASA